MRSGSYYRNFRDLLAKHSNWNFYAGTSAFATNTWLVFDNPVLNTKYEAESRFTHCLKTFIIVSLLSYLSSELIYGFTDNWWVIILFLISHAFAFYSLTKLKNPLLCRIAMEIPFLVWNAKHINGVYSTPSLHLFLPIKFPLKSTILFDLMSVFTWKKH